MKKVPKEKAFYFFTSIGNYTGENSSSIMEFSKKVKEIDSKSLQFHLNRGDFEKWIREVWGYEELAEELKKIEKANLKKESLRNHIFNRVSNFLKVQRKLKEAKEYDVEKYLKQLPPPPEEHIHELRMEKRLKHMLSDHKKKRPERTEL